MIGPHHETRVQEGWRASLLHHERLVGIVLDERELESMPWIEVPSADEPIGWALVVGVGTVKWKVSAGKDLRESDPLTFISMRSNVMEMLFRLLAMPKPFREALGQPVHWGTFMVPWKLIFHNRYVPTHSGGYIW